MSTQLQIDSSQSAQQKKATLELTTARKPESCTTSKLRRCDKSSSVYKDRGLTSILLTSAQFAKGFMWISTFYVCSCMLHRSTHKT